MGIFINGVYCPWEVKLGPNEKLGVEDEMSFQTLAIKLEKQKLQKKVTESSIPKTLN